MFKKFFLPNSIFIALIFSFSNFQITNSQTFQLKQSGTTVQVMDDIYDTGFSIENLPEDSYRNGKIRIKFDRSMEKSLEKIDFSLSEKGYVKTGIKSIDKLNKKYKVFEYYSILDELYEISEASHQYTERHKQWGFHLWYDLKLDTKADIKQVVKEFDNLNEVRIAEPSIIIHLIEPVEKSDPFKIDKTGTNSKWTPNDQYYSAHQWNFNNTGQRIPPSGGQVGIAGWDVNAEAAWDIETGNSDVIVAIIDSGMDYEHADLAGNMWSNIGPQGTSTSPDDHGTHVGGIVAAVSNNNIGVAGLAGGSGSGNGVRLMTIDLVSGGISDINAFSYAADNGAAVTCNSWSAGTSMPPSLAGAMNYFHNNGGGTALDGGVSFAAAGNAGNQVRQYPAGHSDVVAVASHDNRGNKSSFSTYGNWVDITAPGSHILSTVPGNSLNYASGTSMATPHVAGAAALIISNNYGNLSRQDVIDIILESAREDLYDQNPGYSGLLGEGALDVFAALNFETHDITFNVLEDSPEEDPITNATITVNSEQVTTNANGIAIIELTNGDHEANISAPGYESKTVSFSVDGSSKTVEIRMVDNIIEPYNLAVTTEGMDPGEAFFQWNIHDGYEWLHWDNGDNSGSIGLQGGGTWVSAIRFDVNDLFDYDGWEITRINVFCRDIPDGAEVKVWQGSNGGNLTEYISQSFTQAQDSIWVEIELNNTHFINASEELFVGVEWDDAGEGNFPAGVDNQTSSDGKGNLLSTDSYDPSEGWRNLTDYDIDGNWNLQVYVEGSKSLGPKAMEHNKNKSDKKDYSKSFSGYNVFLDGDQVATEIADNEYLFTLLAQGIYTAGVQSVYTTGSSDIIEIDFEITEGAGYTVTFDVVNQSFTPVTDAVVTIEGVAYSQGEYIIDHVLPGTHNFSVANSGFITYFGDFEVDDEDITVQVILEDGVDPVYDVTFNVTNIEDGTDIENAEITFNGNDYYTGAGGSVVINDVDPGFYNYYVEKLGFYNVQGQAMVNDNITIDIEMEVERFTVTFNVIDESSNPIDEAIVTLDGNTNPPGDYVFEDIDVDTYDFTVEKQHFITVDDQITVEGDKTKDVILVVRTYTVTFDIIDEDSDPLVDAVVRFSGIENDAGDYIFDDIEAGTHGYLVTNDGYADVPGAEEIEDDTTIQITMIKAYTVNFEVLDADDNTPITNARITFDGVENSPGDYEFNNVIPDSYDYTARLSGYGNEEGTVTVIDSDITETIYMTLIPLYDLSLQANPPEGGEVLGEGEYEEGRTVTIRAYAEDDYEFYNWTNLSGNVISTNNIHSYEMPAEDITLVANFQFVDAVEDISQNNIAVFPNPANNVFYIESDKLIKQIQILNISGKTVISKTANKYQQDIDISNLRPGFYFIKIHTDEIIITEKLQIIR